MDKSAKYLQKLSQNIEFIHLSTANIVTTEKSLPYAILDHSGDLRIRAHGADFLEALANASSGLIAQIVLPETIEEREEFPISVCGEDDTDKAIAFLNEILYLVHGRNWLPARIRRLTICSQKGCTTVDAVLVGEPFDQARHQMKFEVKAVTYHDFHIEQGGEITSIEFVADL